MKKILKIHNYILLYFIKIKMEVKLKRTKIYWKLIVIKFDC